MQYEWVEIRPYIGVFLFVFNTLRDRMGERSGYPIYRIVRNLYIVANRMTPDQIVEAERLIREWMTRFQEARMTSA